MLKPIILLLCALVVGCATSSMKKESDHRRFMREVEAKKATLSRPDYLNYLKKTLDQKQMHLQALQQQYQEEGERETQFQSSDHSSSDIQHMKVRSSQILLHDLSEKIKTVENEVFFLKSQISSIDEVK